MRVGGKTIVDGVPIVFRVEFSGDQVDRDIEIVELIQAAKQGRFTPQGKFRSHQRVSCQQQKIDLKLVALTLDEFPGGHGRLIDDGQQFLGDPSHPLPRLIESKLGGVDESERHPSARETRRRLLPDRMTRFS